MLSTATKIASYNARSRKGDATRIQDKFEGFYSLSHISNVLSGRRNNSLIVNTAYRMASRRKTNKSFIA
jgi:hypothetical protein